MIDPPAHLDADQREVWARTAAELEQRGSLTAGIADTLAAYCVAVVFHRRAVEIVNKSSILGVSRFNEVRRSPAVQVSAEQTALIVTLAEKLGLSPFDDRKVAGRNVATNGGETRAEAIKRAREMRRRHTPADTPRTGRRSQPRRSNGVHRTS